MHMPDMPNAREIENTLITVVIINILDDVTFVSLFNTQCSSIGDRAFVVAAASVWNKLPQDIRSATLLPVFRCLLKMHLFDNAYNC